MTSTDSEPRLSERPGGTARIQRYRPNHGAIGGFVDIPAQQRAAVALALLGEREALVARVSSQLILCGLYDRDWSSDVELWAASRSDATDVIAAIFGEPAMTAAAPPTGAEGEIR